MQKQKAKNQHTDTNSNSDSHSVCTNCFRSLGVETKMRIYEFLNKEGSSTVNHVVDFIGLSQPTISHHLHAMQTNGLLKSHKKGKEVYFEINPECPVFGEACILKDIKFLNGDKK